MIYLSFSKGYKGGGFNTTSASNNLTNDLIIDNSTQGVNPLVVAESESWDAYVSVDNIEDQGCSTLLQNVGLGATNVYRGMPRLMKVGFNVHF